MPPMMLRLGQQQPNVEVGKTVAEVGRPGVLYVHPAAEAAGGAVVAEIAGEGDQPVAEVEGSTVAAAAWSAYGRPVQETIAHMSTRKEGLSLGISAFVNDFVGQAIRPLQIWPPP